MATKSRGPFQSPMTRYAGNPFKAFTDPVWMYYNQPFQSMEMNLPIYLAASAGGNLALSATGVGLACPIALQEGTIVSNISFHTATTAAGTPTHQYVALYDNSATPALLTTSGDLTSTARAANTLYTVAMNKTYVIQTSGIYFVSISFTATTVPTVLGLTLFNVANAGAINGSPILGQSHGSALAGVAPATIASPTTVAKMFWCMVT